MKAKSATSSAPLLVKSEPRISSPPPTSTSRKRKADTSSASESDGTPAKSAKSTAGSGVLPMTAETKEQLVDHMLRLAYTAMEKDRLAQQLGITKKQLDNAVCLGRTNLRSKLIKAAREL